MIADLLLQAFPKLNEAQKEIVGHTGGPLLVIAGPGSGKTFSLALRALNLLLLGKVQPRELILCTFTEKAAFELRDRMSAAAVRGKYKGDLSELRASTIHGLCNRILSTHRHQTPLGNNYETLDDLTQWLFIFDYFKQIVGNPLDSGYFGKWKTKWTAIEGARDRTLALASDPHTFGKAGRYQLLVKVVDIFGNDTTQSFNVDVK